jgi:NADH-quinone oxidoreductase subunit E
VPVSDTTREAAAALVKRYPVARSALLPLLHLVQSDHGYVTDEGIAFCAESLGLTKAEVGAVATFYTMFKREPVGDYLLSVCTNPTCKIAGAQDIYEGYVDQLGGHRDDDGGVSVEHAECLGICDAAPVVQVNYEMFGPLTKEQADDLLTACRKGAPPASNWSNDVPRTFKEVEFELSGAGDGVNDRLAAAARAQVEGDVPPTYRSGETDIPVTHPGGDPKGVGGEVLRERIAGAAARGEGGEALGAERSAVEDAPHVADEADAGEQAASDDVAGEGRGVAEERSDQASDPTPQPPRTADKVDDQPPVGEMPPEAAGDTPTATEQTQVARKVDEPEPPQTVQGGPETRTDAGQAEADERAEQDPIISGGEEAASAGTEPATDASQTAVQPEREPGPETADDAPGGGDEVAGGAETKSSTHGAEEVAGGAETKSSTHGAEEVAGGAETKSSTHGAEEVAGGAETKSSTHGAEEVAGGAETKSSTHGAEEGGS